MPKHKGYCSIQGGYTSLWTFNNFGGNVHTFKAPLICR